MSREDMMMQMFPNPDLAEVLHRDRQHKLAPRRWLDDDTPRRRPGQAPSGVGRLRRRLGR